MLLHTAHQLSNFVVGWYCHRVWSTNKNKVWSANKNNEHILSCGDNQENTMVLYSFFSFSMCKDFYWLLYIFITNLQNHELILLREIRWICTTTNQDLQLRVSWGYLYFHLDIGYWQNDTHCWGYVINSQSIFCLYWIICIEDIKKIKA